MKKYCFLILLTLTFVSSNSDAFQFKIKQNIESKLDASSQSSEEDLVSSSAIVEFKNEQNNEPKLDASSQLSEEEIDAFDESDDSNLWLEYPPSYFLDILDESDNVSYIEAEIDGSIYTINPSMELYKHSGKTKTKVLQFSFGVKGSHFNTFEPTLVSVFKFGDYHFFEIGTDTFEGYMGGIHVVDLKNKKVLSTFSKCMNQEAFFGLQNGVLTYTCKWRCLKNEYAAFEPKEKKFIIINEKHDCSKLSFNDKHVGLKETVFGVKYRKEKNGVVYKNSRLQSTEKNSK